MSWADGNDGAPRPSQRGERLPFKALVWAWGILFVIGVAAYWLPRMDLPGSWWPKL